MKTTVEKLSPTRAKLTIAVTPEELKPTIDHAYSHIAESVNIPGFRKGKVPPQLIDQRVGRDLTLRTSVYQWDMSGLITQVFDPASGLPPQYQSGDRVDAHGVELSADKTWNFGARLRGSFSLQDAAYSGGGALLNSPRQLGKVELTAPLPVAGLRAGYEWRYESARLTRDGVTLGGYTLSNLSLSTAALAPRLLASVTLDNLFDRRYADPGAENNWQNSFEQDGRSVRLKVSYGF